MILSTNNCIVDEHNEIALEAFPGSAFNQFSSTFVEPPNSSTASEQSPAQDHIANEMAYSFHIVGLSLHQLILKSGALMVIHKVLGSKVVIGRMLFVREHTRWAVNVASVDSSGPEPEYF